MKYKLLYSIALLVSMAIPPVVGMANTNTQAGSEGLALVEHQVEHQAEHQAEHQGRSLSEDCLVEGVAVPVCEQQAYRALYDKILRHQLDRGGRYWPGSLDVSALQIDDSDMHSLEIDDLEIDCHCILDGQQDLTITD